MVTPIPWFSTGCGVTVISDPTAAAVPRADAQRRCQQIHLLLESMTRQKEKVLFLVTEAKEHDDHLPLGYPSWPAYVSAEFTAALTELTRDDRRWFAFALSETGMSSRAIAPIVGVTDRQVRRDVDQVAQVGHHVPPDLLEDHLGEDLEDHLGEDLDGRLDNALAEISKITSTKPTNNVVGIDGKRYPAPKPKPEPARRKPRQKATPGAFWDATYDLQKKLTTLENVVKRDTFARNRKAIREQHLAELIRYSNRLKVVISALTDPVDGDGAR